MGFFSLASHFTIKPKKVKPQKKKKIGTPSPCLPFCLWPGGGGGHKQNGRQGEGFPYLLYIFFSEHLPFAFHFVCGPGGGAQTKLKARGRFSVFLIYILFGTPSLCLPFSLWSTDKMAGKGEGVPIFFAF